MDRRKALSQRLVFGPHLFFKGQYEAAKHAGFKDLYVVFQDIPYVPNLRAGHAKQPFSLENLTSFKYLTFMERSLMSALSAGRSVGAMLYSDALRKRLTWASGIVYRSAVWGDLEIDTAEGFDVTNRITGLLLDCVLNSQIAGASCSFDWSEKRPLALTSNTDL